MFPEWREGTLSAAQRQHVEQHLKACAECRKYFTRLTTVFEEVNTSALPYLKSDPFLPTRIREMERQDGRTTSPGIEIAPGGRLRTVFLTASLLLAMGIGIYLGKGLAMLSNEPNEDEIVNAYSQMFSSRSWVDQWDNAIETTEEEQ